jgi:hypothetical protein
MARTVMKALTALLILLMIIWLYGQREKDKKTSPLPLPGGQIIVEYVTVITHDIDIEFGGKYEKIFILPKRTDFSFVKSTEPYCVINANGEEFCVIKGKDASKYFVPVYDNYGNCRIQFRSSNGEMCYLTIKVN